MLLVVGGRGGGPSLVRRGEKAYGNATASSRPPGPLAGLKRLRATAGQGPNYVGPSCGYVGLCWPILRAMWVSLGLCWPSLGLCWLILKAMWADREAYAGRSWGLCWPMLSQKIRKMGTAKKHCKTRDIWMFGGQQDLKAMLPHREAM